MIFGNNNELYAVLGILKYQANPKYLLVNIERSFQKLVRKKL